MPAVGWLELEEVYRAMVTGAVRVVGWSAGGSFRLAYTDCPLPLAYLVDSDPATWGRRVFGIEVRDPATLAGEDPATTVVVNYSPYFNGAAIARQIEAIGPFRHVVPFAPAIAFPQLLRLRTALARAPATPPPVPDRRPPSARAIVVQGGLAPGLTDVVLRYWRASHPDDWLILSTWDTSAPELVARYRPWCDRLLLNPEPPHPGQGNRNYQMVSARAGLAEAAGLGAAKALKTRTDCLLLAPRVLDQSARLQDLYPGPVCRKGGRRNRLVVSSRFTQKYIPYNISDLVVFGDTEDLLLYFSAPLDPCAVDIHAPEYRRHATLRDYSRNMHIPEIYLAVHYLRHAGHEPDWTLRDSWAAMRDYYVVVDEEWFDYFWPKYGFFAQSRKTHPHSIQAAVDHYFWQALYFGADTAADEAAVEIDTTLFHDFFAVQLPERGVSRR